MLKKISIVITIFISSILFAEEIQLSLKTNQPVYKKDEPVQISIEIAQPSFIYVFTYHSNGKIFLLYPNEFEKENYLEVGKYNFPKSGMDYELLAGEPMGEDRIIAIASKKKLNSLHSDKFWKGEFYSNPKGDKSDYIWQKKVTAELLPEEWTNQETEITIVKDEATKKKLLAKLSKSPLASTTIGNGDEVKPTETKEQTPVDEVKKAPEDPFVFRGKFLLPEEARTKKKKFSMFKVYETIKEDKKEFKLKIFPYSKLEFCEYSINSFENPKKFKKGEFAKLKIEPQPCSLLKTNQKNKIFWSQNLSIYILFRYNTKKKLIGQVYMSYLKIYTKKATGLKVKDNFKFLD